MRTRSIVIWTAVAVVGAVAWGVIALVRGEQISAAWLIFAAVASYAIAYRFYARFIARKVLEVDANRARARTTVTWSTRGATIPTRR